MGTNVGQPARKKRSFEVDDYLNGIHENLEVCRKCAAELELHINGPQLPKAVAERTKLADAPLPEFFMDRVLSKLSDINREVLELRDVLTRVISEF